MGDATAILTFVREVSDPAAVASAVSTVQGALWFDQREFLATTYRAYRERILGLVGLGLVAVFLVLLGRYRRWSVALAAFAPALAAAICTLGALAWGGDELQILHVVGLLLVLSMGVDYGVFLVESRRWARGTSGALLGVLLAWASTVLAFGLLALSANPAMHALGATVGLGVSFSLVLAPLALALLPGEPEIDR
jgi:predicted exporter